MVTTADLALRARRATIRLASMASRCFWVSAAGLVVHMPTHRDCLQRHRHQRVVTRQLHWAMHQCTRHLNGEIPEGPMGQTHLDVQTVSFQFGKGVCDSQPVAAIDHQAEDSSGAAQPADDEDDEASDGASQPVAAEESHA